MLIDEGVTVVTTSNQPPADLYPGGMKRELFLPTIALIEDEFDVVNLDHGQDYRLTGVADTEAWLQPLDDRSARQFQGLFEREAGQARASRCSCLCSAAVSTCRKPWVEPRCSASLIFVKRRWAGMISSCWRSPLTACSSMRSR